MKIKMAHASRKKLGRKFTHNGCWEGATRKKSYPPQKKQEIKKERRKAGKTKLTLS